PARLHGAGADPGARADAVERQRQGRPPGAAPAARGRSGLMADPAVAGSLPPRDARVPPRRLRDLFAIDQHPATVRLCATASGRLVLVSLFAAAAWVAGIHLLPVAVAAAFAYLPAHRGAIALAAALAALALNLDAKVSLDAIRAVLLQAGLDGQLALPLGRAMTAAWLVLAAAALALVRRHPTLLLARRPVLGLLGLVALLCILASA